MSEPNQAKLIQKIELLVKYNNSKELKFPIYDGERRINITLSYFNGVDGLSNLTPWRVTDNVNRIRRGPADIEEALMVIESMGGTMEALDHSIDHSLRAQATVFARAWQDVVGLMGPEFLAEGLEMYSEMEAKLEALKNLVKRTFEPEPPTNHLTLIPGGTDDTE